MASVDQSLPIFLSNAKRIIFDNDNLYFTKQTLVDKN